MFILLRASLVAQMVEKSEVAQSCLTLYNPMNGSLPGCMVHGIFQARVLEWIAISFPRGSSQPWDWIQVSCIADRHFVVWATESACNIGGPGFDSWVGKIRWRKKCPSTPVFLPGEFHGQRSLVGYSPWVAKNQTQLVLYQNMTVVSILGFPAGSVSKNLPVMQETTCSARGQGWIPGSERSPGEGMATHTSILAWEIPWTEEPGRLQSMRWQ